MATVDCSLQDFVELVITILYEIREHTICDLRNMVVLLLTVK